MSTLFYHIFFISIDQLDFSSALLVYLYFKSTQFNCTHDALLRKKLSFKKCQTLSCQRTTMFALMFQKNRIWIRDEISQKIIFTESQFLFRSIGEYFLSGDLLINEKYKIDYSLLQNRTELATFYCIRNYQIF